MTLQMQKSGAKITRTVGSVSPPPKENPTKVMLVTTYQRETKLQISEIKVNFNNTMLENVKSEKLLGVSIDKHLSWRHHIDKTAKTLSKHCPPIKEFTNSYPTRPHKCSIRPPSNHTSITVVLHGANHHTYLLFTFSRRYQIRLIMNVPNLRHCTTFQRMSGYTNSRSGKIQNCHNGVQNRA